MTFNATKTRIVHGKGQSADIPPDSFLAELVSGIKSMPADVFAPNTEPNDVFNYIHGALGPWEGQPGAPERLLHRRAVMAEILRVLGAFESTWDWNCGADTTAGAETPSETEAGLWQVSYNGRAFGADLVAMESPNGVDGPVTFQSVTKRNHPFAMQWAARLFRHTTHANGPLLNLTGVNSIYSQLSPASVTEFKTLLSA